MSGDPRGRVGGAYRVLMVHNHYRMRGGEDHSFAAEVELLRSRGHTVSTYTASNRDLEDRARARRAVETVWNPETYARIRRLVRQQRVEIVHFQNTFPIVSPSAYYAARREGAAVVQALRNYRILCPNAHFFRDGGVCEDCMGKVFCAPGVLHRCYRDSALATGVVAAMTGLHRVAGTWSRAVDAYIAQTEFSREKFVEGGLPADRIHVKPNFLSANGSPGSGQGGYAVFVGRLREEKGLRTLLQAWHRLGSVVPLRIVGDGPLRQLVASTASSRPGIRWLGELPIGQAHRCIEEARLLVFPSECYETFGRTLIEALAAGTPVVATRLGGTPGIVEEGRTGFLYEAGDVDGLVETVTRAVSDSARLERMRGWAREAFEARFTAGANHAHLMRIYAAAIARRTRSRQRFVPRGAGGSPFPVT